MNRHLISILVAAVVAPVATGVYAAQVNEATANDKQVALSVEACVQSVATPRSYVADNCRADGWVVRNRIVIGPAGWVRASILPTCVLTDRKGRPDTFADTGPVPCTWNINEVDDRMSGSLYVSGTNERPVIRYVRGFKSAR